MALNKPDLMGAEVAIPAGASIVPAGPGGVAVCKFAGGTALLPLGTPVCVINTTNLWVAWADTAGAGVNKERVIRGFVYPRTVQLVSGSEVLGSVLLRGAITLAQIKAALAALSITTVELVTALRGFGAGDPSPRELGLFIQDLPLGNV